MTLPPALRAHRLTGIVRLEDGTPAAGVSVVLLDAVRKWLDVGPPVDTDSSGAFSFVVHEGLSYIVSAVYPVGILAAKDGYRRQSGLLSSRKIRRRCA